VENACPRLKLLREAVEASVDAEPEVWTEVLRAYQAHLRGEGG
jgi:hypothetical protein